MEYFVAQNSIVRRIWGKADTVLFIFAGAAAEFALNKAVEWLYFTGKLPADPLGRLFSTVTYAQQIIFSELDNANRAIDKVTAIHKGVEQARDAKIPDWAYRDVLFMLIDYSVRSFELLERKLTMEEKDQLFDVFYRVGVRMNLAGLPKTYTEWEPVREYHLKNDMLNSHYTADLFMQYKKHLGMFRFQVLKQVQAMVVPGKVNEMLSLGNSRYLAPALSLYKLSRIIKMDENLISALLPNAYKAQAKRLTIK
jgi:hypothetical protein